MIEHKFLPISLLKSLELLASAILSAAFGIKGFIVEVSQRNSEKMILADSKIFVYGNVICADVLAIRPYFIGSSKKDYLKATASKFKTSLVVLSIFSMLTAVAYSQIPKKKPSEIAADVNIPVGMDCIICLSHKKKVLFWPCNHLCVCENCFSQITKCPICRKKVNSYYQINY